MNMWAITAIAAAIGAALARSGHSSNTANLLGVDVSHHQGDIDWAKIARSRIIRFAIVKFTEGAAGSNNIGYEDPRARANWHSLQANPSIIRGSYHFARADNRPNPQGGSDEARWYADLIREIGDHGRGTLPPALDWEQSTGSVSNNILWIENFVRTLQEEIGRTPMIYTGWNFWRDTTGDSTAFLNYPLWEVKYSNTGPNGPPPRIPRDIGKPRWAPAIWQWSGGGNFAHYFKRGGSIPGINGIVDINTLFGGESALAALVQR